MLRVTKVISPEQLKEFSLSQKHNENPEREKALEAISTEITDTYATAMFQIALKTGTPIIIIGGMLACLCLIENKLRTEEKEAQSASASVR